MQKNRLFIKIYLWFWLTTIILLLTMLTIDVIGQKGREKEHIEHFVGHILTIQGQQAVNILENESPESFKRFIEDMERMPDFRVLCIFDNQGKELTGKIIPQEISSLVKAALRDRQTAVSVNSGGKNLVLKSVNSYKKKRYFVAAEVRHPPLRLLLPLEPPPGPRHDHRHGPENGPRQHPGFLDDISFLLIRFAAILIVSGFICYLLARYLTAPIIKLSHATHLFAAGNFSTRLNEKINKRKDEISDLALDFDYMAERIESLLTSQRTLLRDVSHELRSPLARINVALELCRSHSKGEAIKYLERIGQDAEELNGLIEQILTLNRVESGIGDCVKKKFNLNNLIERIKEDVNFEAKSKNKSVKVVQSEQCILTGNEKLIRRAIENVLRNAVNYTVSGSTVELSIRKFIRDEHSHVSISVRDFGPGVPEKEITNIFQPFYRINQDRDRKTGGTGIGLAIADAAVRLHGGSIKAVNVPGGGLNVEILLPED